MLYRKKTDYYFISILCFVIFQTYFFLFTFQRSLIFKTSNYTKIPTHTIFKGIELFFVNNSYKTDVIYCHGSILSQKVFKKLLEEMAKECKCNVLSFNICGMFNNRGVPSELNIKKELDIFIEYLTIKRKTQNLVFFGQSLGCSLAIYLNSKIPGLCILENPFLNYRKVISNLFFYKFFTFVIVDNWKNDVFNLKNILFLLSTNDKLVSNEDGIRLSKQCKNGIVKYLKGNSHFNSAKNPLYYKFISQFIGNHSQ